MQTNDSNVLLVDSNHGAFIPQVFAEQIDPEQWTISADDYAILLSGPEHEYYWDTWETVLESAEYSDGNGNTYRLYQDSDLFAICYERLSLSEYSEFFGNDGLYDHAEYLFQQDLENRTYAIISEHYLSALVNADYSGLSEEDEYNLNRWIINEMQGFYPEPIDYASWGFSEDEVSGLMSDCCICIFQRIK